MALQDMQAELRGSVPKLPFAYTKTLINRAWGDIRNSNLWSFQLFESSWTTPPIINQGTVTTVQGSNTIQFDALAQAALATASTPYSLITQRQFRIFVGGIYNIIAYNFSGANVGQATLDRPYGDPGGAGQSYSIYQVYYPAPFIDFLLYSTIRNPQMYLDLILTRTRQWIDERDPQRSYFMFPTHVVPYMIDQRGVGTPFQSATAGFMLFELWGQPTDLFVYQCYGLRRGTDLLNPNDALPFSVPEDLVLAKAKVYAYEWAEANKDITPRATGPDFKFLMGESETRYKKLLTQYRRQDRELVNNWVGERRITGGLRHDYYNTLGHTAGSGDR